MREEKLYLNNERGKAILVQVLVKKLQGTKIRLNIWKRKKFTKKLT